MNALASIGRLIRILLAGVWTALLAIPPLITVTLGLWIGDHVMPRLWARGILFFLGIRVRVIRDPGYDPLAPVVLVSNHRSILDGLVIVATTRRMPRFVVKHSVGRIPLFGLAYRRLGHVLLDRSKGAEAHRALEAAAARIGHRWSLYVAPEGTFARNPDPAWLGPFKSGAFEYARAAAVPVVPVALFGTDLLWPPDSWSLQPGVVTVIYGPPILEAEVEVRRTLAREWLTKTLARGAPEAETPGA